MKFGRRGVLAGAPAAAVALPMAAANIASGMRNLNAGSILGGMVESARDVMAPGVGVDYQTWQKGYDAFRSAMKQHEAGDEIRAAFRNTVGMDADLYAIKSIPPQQKALIQFARDCDRHRQRRTLEERIRSSIAEQFGIKDFRP